MNDRGRNSSFASIRFIDRLTAEVDVIDSAGCVLYRYTKTNPNTVDRNHGGGLSRPCTLSKSPPPPPRTPLMPPPCSLVL